MVIPPQMPQQPIEACDLFGWADAASGRPGVKATQRKEKAATASALPTDVAVPAEPTTNAAEPHSIEISALCIEPELAIRHGLCKAAIVDYAARTERGEQCPPVLVYEIDGKLVLVDGHHRIAALERLDKTSVNAIIVVGSLEEAFEAAIRANRCHGVRLTNKDKRVIVIQALNLFGGKLVLRANQYTTRQANSRDGNSTTLATRAIKVDIFDGATSRNFALDVNARNWLAATKGLSGAALDAAVAQTMKMNPALISLLENTIATNPGYIAESTDKLSKGREFELNYNPTNYWTIKANVSQNETIVASIAKDLTDYLAERMPIWQSIIDQQTGQPWFSSSYAGGTTAERYLPANVNSSLAVALQKQGKSDPQIRKYAANLSTNYRLSGITENKILRRFNVGGAVRWVDKGGIGYYGVEQLPATITALDPNRPVYDKAHTYVDLLIGYRTKLFRDRVGATFQLNVRNVQENGARLQPASALPDGTPNAYRIVDPRQFILSATFDL